MSIHVAITRRVRPGCEAEFEKRLREFAQASFGADGMTGVHLLAPAPGSGSREYGILRSFEDEAARDAFYASPVMADWRRRVAELTESEPQQRELHGLEAFFRGDGGHPPRWKMAVVTLAGVYPASLLVPWGLRPWLGHLPPPVFGLCVATVMVGLLTWAIMPLLVRLLKPWLSGGDRS